MPDQTSPPWLRLISGGLAAYHIAIAMHMLFAPEHWYNAVPGVTATGPINIHFIRDIGAAFLMSGTAFLIFCRQSKLWIAAPIGAVFPGIHGGIHAFSLLTGHTHGSTAVDFFGVVFPGFIALFIAAKAVRTQNKEGHS